MMQRISDLFNEKTYQIPKYQRSYAWDDDQVRDLVADLLEAVELGTPHYIGTIVLAKDKDKPSCFNIVDGQQRTTTLTIFLNELIRRLPDDERSYYRKFYIRNGEFKLVPLQADREFFHDLLEGKIVQPESNSQRRLLRAKEIVNEVLNTLTDPSKFLSAIKNLQVMEFVQDNDGEAIRIFQTVNDRGKSLTNMEKAKSLLVYYSNRFLGGELDDQVNDRFGEIFKAYDAIKEAAETLQITLLANRKFDEDNLMRYHFIAFSDHDYDATPEVVLDYLKAKLKGLKDGDKQPLRDFIHAYVTGLCQFFADLRSLVERAYDDLEYFRFFSVLGPNTNLYPLLTVLHGQGHLDSVIDSVGMSLLRLMTLIDLRVYKVRGTDPRAEISRFTHEVYSGSRSLVSVAKWLKSYLDGWMGDSEFRSNIGGNVYERFRAMLPFVLLEHSETLGNTFTQPELKELVVGKNSALTAEHILAQHPTFSPQSFGFEDEEDYVLHQHHLGNLTLLEKGLNSQANRKNPTEKVAIYDNSVFTGTRQVGTQIGVSRRFHKEDIAKRTSELVEFLYQRYRIPARG